MPTKRFAEQRAPKKPRTGQDMPQEIKQRQPKKPGSNPQGGGQGQPKKSGSQSSN